MTETTTIEPTGTEEPARGPALHAPTRESILADIPLSLACAAHAGTSFVPDRRGEQERESYASTLLADFEALSEYATTDEKRAILAAEFARYRTGYRRRYLVMLGAKSACMSTMITGGSNFPTARNRKRGAAADKCMAELVDWRPMVLAAIRKTLCPELRPVMAGDSDAVERLREKIEKAEKAQEQYKAINAAIRKHAKRGPDAQVAALAALGYSERTARELLAPDFMGRVGIPSYKLTNNNANIRRMRERLAQITEAKSAPDVEVQGEHATMEDSPGDNRVRLIFPDKPDAEVRARLKACGFRWSPSAGAWQAYRNYRTLAVARREAGLSEVSP